MTRTLAIRRLRQRGLRNLLPTDIQFGPGLNILCGDNGQGKTSLLEAIALATTGRSFRTDQARDLIHHHAQSAQSEIDVAELDLIRKQRVELAPGRKTTLVDGKRIARAADFAVLTPIVVFHPADLELVSGPAALRRTLLARISLYLEPYHFDSYKTYQTALRARQRLLADHGTADRGLDAFERVASEHGAIVTAANHRSAEQLILALQPILQALAPQHLRIGARHRPGGTTDVDVFCQQLKQFRQRDQLRGRPLFGPQRDDLELTIDEADARRHASQGQQRLLALTLKLAELSSIRSIRQVHPVLLLDDVSSELDQDRRLALLDWLRSSQSQVFVTTTHLDSPEHDFESNATRLHFRVRGGVAEQTKALSIDR